MNMEKSRCANKHQLEYPDPPTSKKNEYKKVIDSKSSSIVRASQRSECPAPRGYLPFSAVYTCDIPFKSAQQKVFIPGVEVKIEITGIERKPTANFLSAHLYNILITHGEFQWTIKKRYGHFRGLHNDLLLFKGILNIPFPTKCHMENRRSFSVQAEDLALNGKPPVATLPRFPQKPETFVSQEDIPKRIKQLEEYLHSLCNSTVYRNHHKLVFFLEASNLSFIKGLGPKGKEEMLEKKINCSLYHRIGCDCWGLFHRCHYYFGPLACGKWKQRWFFLKDSCFGYICPKKGTVCGLMLFDQEFEISRGLGKSLQIMNLNQKITLRVNSKQSKEWKQHIQHTINTSARDFTNQNPHHSFAPTRPSTKAFYFVDGAGYFDAVADCLEGAKEEIFITDWWLTPELNLKRPSTGYYWRLDYILKRKAAQGVKVFILLYKEVKQALGLNSYYSKSQLESENIKVLRHPNHLKKGVFLWAHHEKVVCVDQSIAFIGGIDLCFGRWDDYMHRLVDLGVASEKSYPSKWPKPKQTSSYPSGRLKTSDLTKNDNLASLNIEDNFDSPTLKRFSPHEEPLHFLQPQDDPLEAPNYQSDIIYFEEDYNPQIDQKDSITKKAKDFFNVLRGKKRQSSNSSLDEEREEMEKAERYAASNRTAYVPENTNSFSHHRKGRSANTEKVADSFRLNSLELSIQESIKDNIDANTKLWIGKDYANFIVKDFTKVDSPFVDLVDRSTTPRMPWHDIGVMVEGAAARDTARHFIHRWNAAKLEKFKKNSSYPYLLPKSYRDISVPNLLPKLQKYNVTAQILRSLTSWSGGFLDPESVEYSIHEAYIDSISKAQHYIYIENQFFITLAIPNVHVRNQIGEALYYRILRAHKAGTVFRVFIVIPLLPGFEGELGTSAGVILHAITHWNYKSISRGELSLLQQLNLAGIEDPSEYVTFHGLRTHSVLEGEHVTEQVYVHSKLMIVDDRVVICGSANINDRSLLGKRDSEVAVLIQDETFVEGRMNGEIFPSGTFAGSLRKRLFREHLGLIKKSTERTVDLEDPTIESFYRDVWIETSRINTEQYEKVFHSLPTDSVKSFAEMKIYQNENRRIDHVGAKLEIDKIKGFLVDFPLKFLAHEILTPPSTSVTGMMPTSLWT